MTQPLVSIVMGSRSDLDIMQASRDALREFDIVHETHVLSAHRTPDALFEHVANATDRGVEVFIAGAGGAAHLPGVIAAKTTVPVLGVPLPSGHLAGFDSLLAIVQMPRGIPVATFAIGKPGAANAALFAVSILALSRPDLSDRLRSWRGKQAAALVANSAID
jgi:5-(carboxyamino)imidazole ribonucleotide mutase